MAHGVVITSVLLLATLGAPSATASECLHSNPGAVPPVQVHPMECLDELPDPTDRAPDEAPVTPSRTPHAVAADAPGEVPHGRRPAPVL